VLLGRCAYCGLECERPEMDHVVALAAGGAHSVENVVPACGQCNRKKNAKPLLAALACLKISPVEYEPRRLKALRALERILMKEPVQ
jgi:5-methylcytosine-specific restriction endonuclease McrA